MLFMSITGISLAEKFDDSMYTLQILNTLGVQYTLWCEVQLTKTLNICHVKLARHSFIYGI